MSMEIEAKVRVPSHDAVRQRLHALGATGGEVTHETNVFFDSPDGALRRSDRGLRIRTNRRPSGTTVVLTCKGPKVASADHVKSREELEVQLPAGSADAMTAVLIRLGYAPTLSFEKRRETWHLANSEVVLDTLPKLGTFVEVEADDAATVRHVLGELGLAAEPLVAESYIALIAAWAAASGSPTHVGFEK